MRFMMIVKATADSEAGQMPSETLLAEMMRYNEQLVQAGVLREAAGLKPSAQGLRMTFSAAGGKTVVEGPFPEPRQLVAGFWIIEVASREAAIDWLKRVPSPHPGADCEVELRPFYELEDFAPSPSIDHARRLEAEQKKQSS